MKEFASYHPSTNKVSSILSLKTLSLLELYTSFSILITCQLPIDFAELLKMTLTSPWYSVLKDHSSSDHFLRALALQASLSDYS